MDKIIIFICLLLCGCSTIPPLKATLIKPKGSLAIIGNKVYKVGDKVNKKRITKIELEKVTFEDGVIIAAKLREYE